MIIAESILALSVLCTIPKRLNLGHELQYISGAGTCFQVSSGPTLEERLTMDIEQISGVREVSVKRNGDSLDVCVVIDNMEFALYEKVIQKELDLFEKFPNLQVRFDVVPFIENDESSLTLNAA